MAWALILHDNQEMRELLEGAVRAALDGMPCHGVQNVDDANNLLRLLDPNHTECALIVASLTVRLDASHAPSVDRRELTGLDFVRQLRSARAADATRASADAALAGQVTTGVDDPPALLIASFIDAERAAEVAKVANTQMIGAQDLFTDLVGQVRKAARIGLTAPQYRVDLDIVLRAGQQCSWRMKGSRGNAVEDTAVMDINASELDTLRTLSGQAGYGNAEYLQALGLSVYKVLMADSLKSGDLEVKLNNSVSSFGGLSVARIRFNVDQSTHRIHLETLAKPLVQNGCPEFWMLKTPMFRKFGNRGGRDPLFKDSRSRTGPVKCLLIQGKVASFAVGKPFNAAFPELKGAKAEIDWLADFLQTHDPTIGEVVVLRHADFEPGTFAAAIEKALTTGGFGLVHYCGHSALHEASDHAYLLLGGHEDDLLRIEDFSAWAAITVQFVFLSSCQGACSQFVMKLVETELVPAVAGFAWPVLDAVAIGFAKSFYGSLFGTDRDARYLEYSFMRAKRQLHRDYESAAHWVAPLLFMQVFDTQTAAT
ncbi:MAG: hypothetical protein JWQ11_2045 [Rhizobacter sp.]|nr:hypothetical protein [Rhizobacter sp.]